MTQNQSIQNVLQQIHEPTYTRTDLSPDLFKICNQQIEQAFDAKNGGFGAAPKFPHPTHIDRLLRYYAQFNLTQQDSPVHCTQHFTPWKKWQQAVFLIILVEAFAGIRWIPTG